MFGWGMFGLQSDIQMVGLVARIKLLKNIKTENMDFGVITT